MQEYIVEKAGERIDNYLANITELSRSKIAKMIKEKKVFNLPLFSTSTSRMSCQKSPCL